MVAAIGFDADCALVELAIRISKGVASQAYVRKFKTFRDYARDDLEQDIFLFIRAAFVAGKYNPAKSAKSTFMAMVAWSGVESLRRKLTVRRRHEFGAIKQHDAIPDRDDGNADMVEMAARFYRQSQKVLDTHGIDPNIKAANAGTRKYSLVSALAIFGLQTKCGLSCREMHHLLASQPDLRIAFQLEVTPSRPQIARCYRAVSQLPISRADKGRVSRQAAASANN